MLTKEQRHERRQQRRVRISTAFSHLKARIKDSKVLQALESMDEGDIAALHAIRAYCKEMINDNKVTLSEWVQLGLLVQAFLEARQEQDEDEKEGI